MDVEPRSYTKLFLTISSVLAVCVFIVPFMSPYGSFTGLDGTPGVMDHWDIWSGKDPFTCILYSAGDISCHQEQARTFMLNGSEMPVCVRDTGLLLGIVIGFAVLLTLAGQAFAERHGVPFIAIFIVLIFTDWVIQHIFDLNVPFTRLLTGLLAGIGFSFIIYLWIVSVVYGRSKDVTSE